MKLETIEDFRRVAKALLDPDTTPQQYAVTIVVGFGYCTCCADVTKYEGHADSEGSTLICLGCHLDFGTSSMRSHRPYQYIGDVSEMPLSAIRQLEGLGKLPSREEQVRCFSQRLQLFVKEQDLKVKRAKSESRAAVKTAGNARKILSQFV